MILKILECESDSVLCLVKNMRSLQQKTQAPQSTSCSQVEQVFQNKIRALRGIIHRSESVWRRITAGGGEGWTDSLHRHDFCQHIRKTAKENNFFFLFGQLALCLHSVCCY